MLVAWKANYELYYNRYSKGELVWPMTVTTILQTVYLAKFYYWEDGYMQVGGLDRPRCDQHKLISRFARPLTHRWIDLGITSLGDASLSCPVFTPWPVFI